VQVLRVRAARRRSDGHLTPWREEYTVEAVPASATWALRRAVLRPARADTDLALPDDDAPETGTYAALDADSAVVSSARVAPSPLPAVIEPDVAEGPVWRLRGMATRPELRGRGIGSAVLARAIAHVAEHGGRLLWCNARLPARTLYLRAGFVEAGDPWDDPELGPHVVMWTAVNPKLRRPARH
jgi:GNAT superfamily N-acetyltransferase